MICMSESSGGPAAPRIAFRRTLPVKFATPALRSGIPAVSQGEDWMGVQDPLSDDGGGAWTRLGPLHVSKATAKGKKVGVALIGRG
jgi:hypothetical protein